MKTLKETVLEEIDWQHNQIATYCHEHPDDIAEAVGNMIRGIIHTIHSYENERRTNADSR